MFGLISRLADRLKARRGRAASPALSIEGLQVALGQRAMVLTPMTGCPREPGLYICTVERRRGHSQFPGFDPEIVRIERMRDGAHLNLPGRRTWHYKVTVTG